MKRLVVCGDSTATRFGLAGSEAEAYPQALRRELSATNVRVVSTARSGALIVDTLAKMERVLGSEPNFVIVAHGGRECLLTRSRRLNLIWTDPDARISPGVTAPLRLLKRFLYRSFLTMLHTRLGPVAMRMMGATPYMRPRDFRVHMNEVVDKILRETDAYVIILMPAASRMTIWPWCRRSQRQVRSILMDLRHLSTRVAVVDLEVVLSPTRTPDNFQYDGVHYSADGHRRVKETIMDLIARQSLPASNPSAKPI